MYINNVKSGKSFTNRSSDLSFVFKHKNEIRLLTSACTKARFNYSYSKFKKEQKKAKARQEKQAPEQSSWLGSH